MVKILYYQGAKTVLVRSSCSYVSADLASAKPRSFHTLHWGLYLLPGLTPSARNLVLKRTHSLPGVYTEHAPKTGDSKARFPVFERSLYLHVWTLLGLEISRLFAWIRIVFALT